MVAIKRRGAQVRVANNLFVLRANLIVRALVCSKRELLTFKHSQAQAHALMWLGNQFDLYQIVEKEDDEGIS